MDSKRGYMILFGVLAFVLAGAVFSYVKMSHDLEAERKDALMQMEQEGVASEAESIEAPAEAASDFTVIDMEGNEVSLSDFRGKPVIVNFWATWCPPCQAELPDFEEVFQEYGDDVVFMMVNLTDGYRDTAASVQKFVDKNGYTFPVYLDTRGSGVAAYGIMSIPVTVVVDSDGNQKLLQVGAISEETLREYVEGVR